MARTTHVTKQPVVLEGYQAIFQPGQYGFKLSALIGDELVEALEKEREDLLNWCKSKAKNPRRAVCKPEPWEEVAPGKSQVKFSWKEGETIPVFDSKGVLIRDKLDVRSGSTVKLSFYQKPYILPDDSYGTSLKLVGVQLVTINGGAGVDAGDMSTEDIAAAFGTCDGFTVGEPNVTAAAEEQSDDDF